MSSFPNVASKLGAATKKSIFERQKEEAEAKKAREKAETAAVYEDFVKSFDDDEPPPSTGPRGGLAAGSSSYGSVPAKRHFTSVGLKSGPGSLGPSPGASKSGPGSLGSAAGTGKKRPFDDFAGWRDRDRNRGMFSYNETRDRRDSQDTFNREAQDDRDTEELKAAAKPTLHLSSLPSGTSPAVVKALLTPSPLVVENVRILPAVSAAERKSISAIVTLAAETPATDIDTMVSQLQNKYVGFGFNLSISRHLSSAALTGTAAISAPGSNMNALPFGAKPIQQLTSLSRAPPPGHGPGRFAPPASYVNPTPYGTRPQTQVTVQPPSDLKELKLVHKTLEALLTYGPEFEALLMSRPQVQRDVQWAWLWNSRSTGGVYYRWRLWEILTDANARRRRARGGYSMKAGADTLFEGQSQWLAPENGLKFEYTTRLDDFISDDDYNSSDEEGDDEGGIARRYNDHNVSGAPPPDAGLLDKNDGLGYLNPLAKTKLVHLLSRLPDSNAKLRKGDVARITGFAIEHAGTGADEVAAVITRNVVKPFCHQSQQPEDTDELEATESRSGKQDTTPASLVGLYVISDILSSSASAGVRHAWRYRALFENVLRQQIVFEKLGRADKELAWGKLKAEKWKRSVQVLLNLWEGWCVFPQAAHDRFIEDFLNPPMNNEEQRQVEEEERQKAEDEARRAKIVNKWKSVEAERYKDSAGDVSMGDGDGMAMAEEEGEAMDEDDFDENIDGVPMEDSSDEEVLGAEPETDKHSKISAEIPDPKPEPAPPLKRQRPKAVDMFADDSE